MKKVLKKETPPHWQAIVIEMNVVMWEDLCPKSSVRIIPFYPRVCY
jgi:hypothetical protein